MYQLVNLSMGRIKAREESRCSNDGIRIQFFFPSINSTFSNGFSLQQLSPFGGPKVPNLQILQLAIPHFPFSQQFQLIVIETHWIILGHNHPPYSPVRSYVLMQTTWTKNGERDSPKEMEMGSQRNSKQKQQMATALGFSNCTSQTLQQTNSIQDQ